MIRSAERRRFARVGGPLGLLVLANALVYLVVIRDGRPAGPPSPLAAPGPTEVPGAPPGGDDPEARSRDVAFEKQNVDLGQCYEGDLVRHTYQFTNRGRSPVRVLSATGSCACTAGKYTEGPVTPSSSGSVSVEVKTAGKEGRFQGKITVTFEEDGAKFAIPLSLSVSVMTPGKLAAHPTSINLGDVDSGDVIRKSVGLTVGEGLAVPPKILKVDHPDFITPSVREEGKGKYAVDLTITAPSLKGELLGFVDILTSSPKYPKMTLPVTGRVRGRLDCEPRSLVKVFATGGGGRGDAAQVVMRRSDRAEFSIRKIRVNPDDEGIRVTDEGGDPKARRLLVSLVDSNGAKRVRKGDIYLECSYDGTDEVVRIPFLFIKNEQEGR